MTFLEFVKNKQTTSYNEEILNEAFKKDKVGKAHDLMLKLFKKKLDGKTFMMKDPIATTVNKKSAKSYVFLNVIDNQINMMWTLNYLINNKSAEVYSIDFFTPTQANIALFGSNNVKTSLTIWTLGQSVAYFMPIIIHVVANKDFSITGGTGYHISDEVFHFGEEVAKQSENEVEKKSLTKECKIWHYGNVDYKVFENLDEETIEEAFHLNQGHRLVNNGSEFVWETEAEDVQKQVRSLSREARKNKNNSKEAKDLSIEIDKLYKKITDAINGGAETIDDLTVAIGKEINVNFYVNQMNNDDKTLKNPDQAFKEMSAYIKTVIKGIQPGCILCGAPGIGKTYRVLKQLSEAGYENGKNLHIIKGKCTTRQLYLELYKYKDSGNILLVDDADSLVGPKAPEDTINILKAALDSTASAEGRIVTYKVSGKLEDEDGKEVPKEFYYNGSMIVITNYSAGQLDTALKGRVFIQSLEFNTKQVLKLIKDIMDKLGPAQLSGTSKVKAMSYLEELAAQGSDMEISPRTFITCARIFQIAEDDEDYTDEDARSMIEEQLKLQYARGGKKF